MKALLALLFIVIFASIVPVFIYFITYSYYVLGTTVLILSLLFILILAATMFNTTCPKCNGDSAPTGIGGSEFKQYRCHECNNVFWKKHSEI